MSNSKLDLSNEISNTETIFTGTDIDKEDIEGQEKLRQLKLLRYASNTKDRQWLAVWTSTVIPVWLFFVLITLWGNTNYCKLSETVLVALLGTTTLNVLGLAYIVLKGHFGNHEPHDT